MTLGHVCCLCMYFGCLWWPHSRFCFLPFLGAGPSCCGWYIISWLPYPLDFSCWYDAYLLLWCILLWPLVLKVCFSLRKCGCFFLLVIGALSPFVCQGFCWAVVLLLFHVYLLWVVLYSYILVVSIWCYFCGVWEACFLAFYQVWTYVVILCGVVWPLFWLWWCFMHSFIGTWVSFGGWHGARAIRFEASGYTQASSDGRT